MGYLEYGPIQSKGETAKEIRLMFDRINAYLSRLDGSLGTDITNITTNITNINNGDANVWVEYTGS